MNEKQVLAEFIALLDKGRGLLPVLASGSINWLEVFKNIPAIFSFMGQLKEFFLQTGHLIDVLKKVPEMKAAIEKGRDTGDTSDLEKLFGGGGNTASPSPK